MNDPHPQQHAKEEISAIPRLFALKSLEHDKEPDWDPRVSWSSRPDEDQLDPSLDGQLRKLKFHGHDTTISVIEKSFKDEEYIYVSNFPPFCLNLQNAHSLYYRLNLRKVIDEIQSISLDQRNGLSQL